MLQWMELGCGRVGEPRRNGAATVDRENVPTANSAESAEICLCRLTRLAPQVANELLASWSDPDRATRVIEELLGGGREVNLQLEAIIELVRLYEYLEGVRNAAAADQANGSRLSHAQPLHRCQSSQV